MAKFNARAMAGGVIGAVVVAGAMAMIDKNNQTDPSGVVEKGKERCFGVAKAGENGCAAANGSHTCTGLSKVDYSGSEWMLVPVGSCINMGGKMDAFENPSAPDDAAPDGTTKGS